MASIRSVTLEAPDPAAAKAFHAAAFDLDDTVRVRAGDAPTTGFRGYTRSLVVSQPSTVDSLVGTALDAGATSLKPARKGFWGYGGVMQAPDDAIWKVATSAKKDTGPTTRKVDEVVLLLGLEDVRASRQSYVERGLAVAKSFGSRYVELESHASAPDGLAWASPAA
ncbi:glyoxalase [Nocardioides sp. MAHUQ-72]|uniref:glyoxalase n=1 Tax=unclassified Nocardioides TaxID=2615069 RepID=UPI003617C786